MVYFLKGNILVLLLFIYVVGIGEKEFFFKILSKYSWFTMWYFVLYSKVI